MILRVLTLILGAAVTFSVLAGGIVNLSAHPGEVNVKTFGPASSQSTVSVSFELIEFRSTEEWPAAAYVGFYQGQSRDNSVQFVLIRNKMTDDYLVAGYRLVENGQETKVEFIAKVPLNRTVTIDMAFKKGIATITLKDQQAINVRTSLKKVAPYVAVSSGVARFDFGP